MAQLLSGLVPPPEPGVAVPPDDLERLQALARGVGFRVPGVEVSLDEHERASWQARTEPAIRRFIEDCPDFGQGVALLFGVPIRLSTIIGLPLRLFRSR